jgi:hypothetical protein
VRIHPDAVKNVREIKLIDLPSERSAGVVVLIVVENLSTTCCVAFDHLATASRRRLIWSA